MNIEIEKLIDIAAKGDIVTSRQKELILKKAITYNEDPDEVEYLLEMKHKDYHPKKVTDNNQEHTPLQENNIEIIDGFENSKESNKGNGAEKEIVDTFINKRESATVSKNPKGKSKMIACLLAFFLGGLGVHKFYIGNTKSGFMYILFSWTFIPMFLGLIDAFVFLYESEDEFYSKIK